jgi:hypothetical protein
MVNFIIIFIIKFVAELLSCVTVAPNGTLLHPASTRRQDRRPPRRQYSSVKGTIVTSAAAAGSSTP